MPDGPEATTATTTINPPGSPEPCANAVVRRVRQTPVARMPDALAANVIDLTRLDRHGTVEA